jgi:hypothetical protein
MGEVVSQAMDYYYINTEAKNFGGKSPHEIWLQEQSAFVSGEEYGPKLDRLNPGDICFMYVNGCGVMAVGKVLEHWNGQQSDPPRVYTDPQDPIPEYRISVDWFLTFQHYPINARVLRDIIGWTSPQAIQRITNQEAAERLLHYALQQSGHS